MSRQEIIGVSLWQGQHAISKFYNSNYCKIKSVQIVPLADGFVSVDVTAFRQNPPFLQEWFIKRLRKYILPLLGLRPLNKKMGKKK